jgi:hypothetical protein
MTFHQILWISKKKPFKITDILFINVIKTEKQEPNYHDITLIILH